MAHSEAWQCLWPNKEKEILSSLDTGLKVSSSHFSSLFILSIVILLLYWSPFFGFSLFLSVQNALASPSLGLSIFSSGKWGGDLGGVFQPLQLGPQWFYGSTPSLDGKAYSGSNPVSCCFNFPTPLITGSREISVKVWHLNHLLKCRFLGSRSAELQSQGWSLKKLLLFYKRQNMYSIHMVLDQTVKCCFIGIPPPANSVILHLSICYLLFFKVLLLK